MVSVQKGNRESIQVLSSKYVPHLGHLFLISVNGKSLIAIGSKFGVELLELNEDSGMKSNLAVEEGQS